MNIIRLITLSMIVFISLYAPAYAKGPWQQDHPRRVEINQRINKQEHFINQQTKTGAISPEQAAQLKNQDHQIRQEERLMSEQHNGSLTPQEQATLNQQENHIIKRVNPVSNPQNGAITPPNPTTLNQPGIQPTSQAGAQTNPTRSWEQDHPRRAEVNERISNQEQYINQEVKEGKLSPEQAAQLKNQDHQIRQEERLLTEQHNGSLTPQEQETLKQQENKILKEIRQK